MNCMGDHSTASPKSFKPFEDLDVDLEVGRRVGVSKRKRSDKGELLRPCTVGG